MPCSESLSPKCEDDFVCRIKQSLLRLRFSQVITGFVIVPWQDLVVVALVVCFEWMHGFGGGHV